MHKFLGSDFFHRTIRDALLFEKAAAEDKKEPKRKGIGCGVFLN